MGDKSPKDREKKKKQHDKEVADLNRAKQEKAQKRAAEQAQQTGGKDQSRKAS